METTAILLAGTLRPSELQLSLRLPILRLPVRRDASLLDAWHETLAAEQITDVRIVVNHESDIEPLAAAAYGDATQNARSLRFLAEPAAWRGVGGIVRDVTDEQGGGDRVLIIEAHRLPPQSLAPVMNATRRGDAGVVGVAGDGEPAGVYLFTAEALQKVPRVGYYDVKEQFLPALYKAGLAVRTGRLGNQVHRIKDLDSYLAATRFSLAGKAPDQVSTGRGRDATVSDKALFDGFHLVEPGCVIEDGAVVHDTVIMAGARIGADAILSGTVVGPGATVVAGTRVSGEIVAVDSESRVMAG